VARPVPHWLEQVVRYAPYWLEKVVSLLTHWLEQVVRCPAAPIKCNDSSVADANYNIPYGNIVYVAFNDPDILKGRGE
jgi:hypothetical protein